LILPEYCNNNLTAMIDTTFLDQLARFQLIVKKRVTSSYVGQRMSASAGRGLMFKDHRIYAPGDDFRAIDWRVYARTDDLMVKVYEEERNLTVHVIMDSSASMNYGRHTTKFEYASMIGIGFAYLSMRDNEKFVFSTFADELDLCQAKRGMGQLASMVHYLNNVEPQGHSRLMDAITAYHKQFGSKGYIVLISDFLVNLDEVKEALWHLGKHQVRVVQVLDPQEKSLKMEGDFRFRDAESGKKLRTYVSPRLRAKCQQLLDAHTHSIKDYCRTAGMHFTQVTTDMEIFDAFYSIMS